MLDETKIGSKWLVASTHIFCFCFVSISHKYQILNYPRALNQCSSHFWHSSTMKLALTYFDMKLQVFIHGIDIVKDVLHYPGDDAHCICVMEITLQIEKKTHAM